MLKHNYGMANIDTITQVGETTKYKYTDGQITYRSEKIKIDVNGDNIKIKNEFLHPSDPQSEIKALFGQISDNFGTNTAEEYVEHLILNVFFSGVADDGVPFVYSKQSANGKLILLMKGQLNKWRIRPQVLNEHVESSRAVQSTVSSGNIVGQIFKASQDNINGISISVKSAEGIAVDDFESYADSPALQAAWQLTGSNLALLETVIVRQGLNSMELPGNTVNDEWAITIASQDLTDYSFSFLFHQTRTYVNLKYVFFVSDGTDRLTSELIVGEVDTWLSFFVNINSMIDSGTTDVTAITSAGFKVVDSANNEVAYVDLISSIPPAGRINAKLWDFGASLPVSGVDGLNDATQYLELGDKGIDNSVAPEVELTLLGGHELYLLNDFVAGVALEMTTNTPLIVNNYYAITLHHIDTNSDVFGPDTSEGIKYYNNGFAFTAADESSPITAIGEFSDIAFSIFSIQDVYVNTYNQRLEKESGEIADPGINSSLYSHIEDQNMRIIESVTTRIEHGGSGTVIFQKPMFMPKGSKFEIYLNDDFKDQSFALAGAFAYFYIPQEANG